MRSRAPQEHPPYVATGLAFVCCGLFFDLGGDNESVGAAVAVAVLAVDLLAVMVGTHVPFCVLIGRRGCGLACSPAWP